MVYILLMIILIIILLILHIGIRIAISYEKTGCLEILILKKIKIYTYTFSSNNNENNNSKELLKLAKPCLDEIILFLKKFKKSCKINRLNCHINFGLKNYADTGKYIGYIWTIATIINTTLPKTKISAEPNFIGKIDIIANAIIDINLLKLIIPTIRLLLSKDIRKLIKGVRDEKRI